jgi:hypothetical protein
MKGATDMPEVIKNKLAWGLNAAVPEDAAAAWGARLLIISDTGHVDILGDRTDLYGDRSFLELLTERFPPRDLRARVAAGLLSGEFTTRSTDTVTLYTDPDLTVVANPNASHGYLYVAAFPTEEN